MTLVTAFALAMHRTCNRARLQARQILPEKKRGFSRCHGDPFTQFKHPSITSSERTFFVTSSISDKRQLLQSDRSAQLFLHVLYHYRNENKFRLHAFVVMPDHFHLLVTVNETISIERAVQFVKGGFAYRAGKALRFRPPVWQKGFSEIRMLDEPSFLGIREYIHNNPVRAHLVTAPEQYRYSSAFPGIVLDPMPQRLKPLSLAPSYRRA